MQQNLILEEKALTSQNNVPRSSVTSITKDVVQGNVNEETKALTVFDLVHQPYQYPKTSHEQQPQQVYQQSTQPIFQQQPTQQQVYQQPQLPQLVYQPPTTQSVFQHKIYRFCTTHICRVRLSNVQTFIQPITYILQHLHA